LRARRKRKKCQLVLAVLCCAVLCCDEDRSHPQI
jgi:hypothetical protein